MSVTFVIYIYIRTLLEEPATTLINFEISIPDYGERRFLRLHGVTFQKTVISVVPAIVSYVNLKFLNIKFSPSSVPPTTRRHIPKDSHFHCPRHRIVCQSEVPQYQIFSILGSSDYTASHSKRQSSPLSPPSYHMSI